MTALLTLCQGHSFCSRVRALRLGAQHVKNDPDARRIIKALMPDALHPSASGMDALAACLAPEIAPHLPKGS